MRNRLAAAKRFLGSEGGFTIIEMLTVLMIFTILSSLVIFNSTVGNRRQTLRDAASQLVTLARKMEAQAASGAIVAATGKTHKAYGVCVTSSQAGGFPDNAHCAPVGSKQADAYQLYARQTTDTNYAAPPADPVILQTVTLPKDVTFDLTAKSGAFWFDFLPPQPTMLIKGQASETSAINNQLVLRYKANCNDAADCATLRFRPLAGVIYVQ